MDPCPYRRKPHIQEDVPLEKEGFRLSFRKHSRCIYHCRMPMVCIPFALDAFNLENARNDILLFFAVIILSMAIKIFSIHQDFEAISPLYFRDLKGRIISSCIYAFILITMGIILSLTAGIPMIRTVSYITGAVFAAAYVIIFNTHKPRIKEKGSTAKVSFFNRLSAKKRLEYETITWQFHKSSDLSDLEYEVLNRDPELKAEYDDIQ